MTVFAFLVVLGPIAAAPAIDTTAPRHLEAGSTESEKTGAAAETTTPVTRRFQLTPVATLEVAVSARQVKFATAGTTQTVRFLVTDDKGEPLAGVRLTPVVVSEPEGTRRHMQIAPSTAITDPAGYVTFQIFSGDHAGTYDVLLFQNRPTEEEIVFTRLEFVVQDANWATMLIFSLAGGLAIFLFGLKTASDGLQALLGERWKQNFAELTRTPLRGMLVGFAVTTLTQSSGATTALLMSFVRAGALSFANSVGVILGASIAGTITAQLISLNLFAYALPAVAVGFAAYLGAKNNKRLQASGLAIMGFGLVFFGMKIMTDQMAPLKLYPWFTAAIKSLGEHPVWAVIFSFLFTALAQSSGATVGIILSLAREQLMTLQEAVPMFFGAAIGASTTGLTAAIGAPPEAKRIALAHLLYKVTGTIVFLPFIAPLAGVGMWLTTHLMLNYSDAVQADVTARAVANTYTLFMVATALLTIPFISQLEKVCLRLVPETARPDMMRAKYLELSTTDTPAMCFGAARREISRMGRFVEEMMHKIGEALFERNADVIPFIRERDRKVDMLYAELTNYLIELTRRRLPEENVREATSLLFIVSDLEAIGDIIDKNLVPLANKLLAAEGTDFSTEGKLELQALHSAVMERLSQMIIALTTRETTLAELVVKGFDRLQAEGKLLHYSHLVRLRERVLESIETSSVHLDVINYLLRIDYLIYDVCLHLLGRGLPEIADQNAAFN
jgi:phosphate:Na+ symporter